jgi:hypothetical protein
LCNCCGANQLLHRRRNLYVVLDDWEKDFSLHKLTMEDLVGGHYGDAAEVQCLPDPIFRLSVRAIGTRPRFHAVGSNIVTSDNDAFLKPSENSRRGLTLVYNSETAAMEIENSLPPELALHHDAMAASDKLYPFGTYSGDSSGVHCLGWTKPHDIRQPLSDNHRDNSESDGSQSDDEWAWERVPHALRPQPRWAWERIHYVRYPD